MYFSLISQMIIHEPLTTSLNIDLELHLRVKLLVHGDLVRKNFNKEKEQLDPIDQDTFFFSIRLTNG